MLTDSTVAELFCGTCGFVLTERIEELGPERRSFSLDEHENRSRTGAPASLAMHDMGLSTIIGHANKDVTGKPLSISMRNSIERLRTWDSRSQIHESIDRNFRQAFSDLDRLKSKLALSDVVIEKTAYIYRKALEKGLIRGRTIQSVLAACVYAACRYTDVPRTLTDVGKGTNVKRKDAARCYRLLLRELDLKMPVIDPITRVARIASKAGLGEKTKRKALSFLKDALENEITAGKDPMGLAAAALYLSCVHVGEDKSQKDIAKAADMTEVTIRNRYKELKESLKL